MLQQLGPWPRGLASIENLLQARSRQPQIGDQRVDAARPGHFFPPFAPSASAPPVAVKP